MNFVALDFETANEQRNSACAIGLTRVRNGVVSGTVEYRIRPPELRFSYWNTQVHGITEKDVRHSLTFGELWPKLESFLQDDLIVAHNASFDMSVLRHSLQAVGMSIPRSSYLCSLQLSRHVWPKLTSHSLGFLAKTLQIPIQHHNAGSDAHAAAQVVLRGAQEKGMTCVLKLAEHCKLKIKAVCNQKSSRVPN